MEKYYTVIVGRDEEDYPEFLIAPEKCYFSVGDVVISERGREYFVKFVNTYTLSTSQLFLALEEALGDPVKVSTKVIREEIDWGDENETTTNTPCDDDSRSGDD